MPLPYNRKRQHSLSVDTDSPDDGSGSKVKVVVRIRPQNSREVEGNHRAVVQAVNENILVFDPKENPDPGYGTQRRQRDVRKRANKDLKFGFDYVFGQDSNNTDVFNETTRAVLESFLEGYNCSVFAYGATGAGKTHTMLGNKENPGVIYQTMMALYEHIDGVKDTKTCDVAVSYLEVYNETIRDLLVPKGVLPIREDPGKGVVIPGLSLHKPKTAEELLYMLQYGNQHRTQHPTDANAESSRSHAVFQVFVRQKDRTANISAEVRIAKMCLVDLAGSERATVTKNSGSRMREGANINRSLLALGNVINALAENKKNGFIPYRDSKLTRLLKDSLGGNCRTVMIAAVSPSAMSYEDTYNTLRYADRAKHIKATLKKNLLSVDFHMAKYGQIVEELRREISELKCKLKAAEVNQVSMPESQGQVAIPDSFIGYQQELSQFYTGHLSQRSDQLRDEIAVRSLQWKMYRKQRCLTRLRIADEPSNSERETCQSFGKTLTHRELIEVRLIKVLLSKQAKKCIEEMVAKLHQKSSCLSIASDNSRKRLLDGNKKLADLEQKTKSSVGQDGLLAELLSLSLQVHRLELDLQDLQQHLGYTKHVVKCQEKELNHNERLLLQLLKLIKTQHCLLQGRNLLTPDLEESYLNVQRRVGGQELVWGDELGITGYTRKYTLSDMLNLPSLGGQCSTNAAETEGRSTVSLDGLTEQLVSEPDVPAQLYQFSAAQACFKSRNLKVDECSPPKAKRVMLAAKTVNPTRPIDRRRMGSNTGSKQTTNQKYQSRRMLANQQAHPSSMGQVSKNSRGTNPNSKSITMNRANVSGSLRTPSKQVPTESTPEEEPSRLSRFSFVTDTITKAKKCAQMHAKSEETKSNELNETFDLDGTFTIDPSVNPLPPSVIPCVDDVMPQQCDTSTTAVTVQSVCDSVSCVSSENKQSCQCHRSSSQSPCVCHSQQYSASVSHQSVPSIVIESQTDTQTHCSPGNESGTSTIMNQSGNSQSSLVSISTLVDGQNLSQNLSNAEDSSRTSSVGLTESQRASEAKGDTCVDDSKKSFVCDRPSLATAATTHRLVGETCTQINSNSCENSKSQKPTKAARCITFQDEDHQKEKGCAEDVRTPERTPLRPVENMSKTLSARKQLEDYSAKSLSRLSSDLESSLDQSSPADAVLIRQKMDLQQKENIHKLQSNGLPSLMAGSIISKDPLFRKHIGSSYTPGYMKPTKSHHHRTRNNTSQNSPLDTSEEVGQTKTNTSQTDRNKAKRPNRPLMPHMRSKSMSNLSSRGGWQI